MIEYETTPATTQDFVDLCLRTVEEADNRPCIVHTNCNGTMEYSYIADSFRCSVCGQNWSASGIDSGDYDGWIRMNFEIRNKVEVLYIIEQNKELGCFMARVATKEERRDRKPKTVNEVFGI